MDCSGLNLVVSRSSIVKHPPGSNDSFLRCKHASTSIPRWVNTEGMMIDSNQKPNFFQANLLPVHATQTWKLTADAVLWEQSDEIWAWQCPITSEHPTKGHTLKLMESHIPCTSIVLRSSIDEAEKERLRLRHSEIHRGSSNQNILSRKHRQLQAGNVNNNWPWIRVTLHLNGLIVCYMSDWELPLRQNDLRSRLRPRCNRFHLTLT